MTVYTVLRPPPIAGDIAPDVFGWAGVMFVPGSAPMRPVNLSNKRAISFWTKGDGKTYQLMLFAKSKGFIPASKTFNAGPEWKKITLPFSAFDTDGSDVEGLLFSGLPSNGHFAFFIDNVRLEQ